MGALTNGLVYELIDRKAGGHPSPVKQIYGPLAPKKLKETPIDSFVKWIKDLYFYSNIVLIFSEDLLPRFALTFWLLRYQLFCLYFKIEWFF